MHHRPHRLHLPSKPHLHPLHEVRCDLDMAYISGMPLRCNIIVLQDTCRIEVVDEVSGPAILVVFNDSVYLVDEERTLFVCHPRWTEAAPKRLHLVSM